MKLFEASAKGLTAQLMQLNDGIRLWKWCIIFVHILAVEILLLKFWK